MAGTDIGADPGIRFDPTLDLVLERTTDLPRRLLWQAWTTPEHLVHWFTPDPWKTVECEIDLRPGGKFRTVMRSPEGQDYDNSGCYLEVRPEERLVWTDTLLPGYRPSPNPFFTAALTFEELNGGTRYTAFAMHKDAPDREKHQAMGFDTGWGTVFDQLVAYLRKTKA